MTIQLQCNHPAAVGHGMHRGRSRFKERKKRSRESAADVDLKWAAAARRAALRRFCGRHIAQLNRDRSVIGRTLENLCDIFGYAFICWVWNLQCQRCS